MMQLQAAGEREEWGERSDAVGRDRVAMLRGWLEAYARQRARVRLVRGAGRAVTVAMVWMLLWCGADWLLELAAGTRVVGLVMGVALVVGVMGRALEGRARAADVGEGEGEGPMRPEHVRAARQIERRMGALEGRLETVVSQLAGPAVYRGSAAMLEQLMEEVCRIMEKVDVQELAPWAPAVRAWALAGGVVLVVGALGTVDDVGLAELIKRLVMPVR